MSFTECLVGICTISGGKVIVVRERLTSRASLMMPHTAHLNDSVNWTILVYATGGV